MKYMLDTNVCIDYLRGNNRGVVERVLECDSNEMCISSITLSELLFGINRSADPQKNRSALYLLLTKLDVMDYGAEASEHYGIIRNDLVKRGLVIGSLDMLIAAHALSEDLILVTHNTSEFSRIIGLKVEDWYNSHL